MSKLVVFGATGQQGYSVITTVLSDPVLSTKYAIRAITRDASSPKAQDMAKQGIEVVEADVDDPASLPRALENAHTVFLVTATIYEKDLKEREFSQAKAVADTAVAAGAEYLIFSTCVHCNELWNDGPVDSFDSKAEVEKYLRTLPLKTAFFAPGSFMQNMLTYEKPRLGDDGVYSFAGIFDPEAKLPLIETAADSGKYVAPLLRDPEGMAGKTMYAATKLYSHAEMAEIATKASGKTVRYVKIPDEVFAGFMEPEMSGRIVAMMKFIEEVGYYGPDTERRVEETVALVDGRLTTLEEFADKYLADL